jgi:sirohydrochlorin cobaltochelatase
MSSADFIYRDDGRPDWGSMWGSFCELALYGGPPHRGPDSALQFEELAPLQGEMVSELQRGVWETTGLFSEPAPPSWLAVSCSSKRMAAWMCAAIILENVDARCEDEVLYVPASADFELKDQVKSVITVVAKVHHYWQAHLEANGAAV